MYKKFEIFTSYLFIGSIFDLNSKILNFYQISLVSALGLLQYLRTSIFYAVWRNHPDHPSSYCAMSKFNRNPIVGFFLGQQPTNVSQCIYRLPIPRLTRLRLLNLLMYLSTRMLLNLETLFFCTCNYLKYYYKNYFLWSIQKTCGLLFT